MRIAPLAGVGAGSLVLGLIIGAVLGRADGASRETYGRSVGDQDRADLQVQLATAIRERDEARAARDQLAKELAPGTPGVDVGGALAKAQAELEALRQQMQAVREQAAQALATAQAELASARQQLNDIVAKGGQMAGEATAALQQRIAQLEREVQDLRRQSDEARAESARWRETAQSGTTKVDELTREVERLNTALRATRFGGG